MVPIFTKNQDEKLRPASTTKIMTALVAMEAFGFGEVVTSKNASSAIGKAIHLTSGEQVAFGDMLYGLLLESGNDVALTLAENYPGGYGSMVGAMNTKARELGMSDSLFNNVSWIDQSQHVATVHDLAILTSFAMNDEHFAQIVATREKEIRSTDGNVVHSLKNTNELLGAVEGVLGVKTGWTALAGQSLITFVERGDHRVILVILGSQDRFGETKRLIDWVINHHQWSDQFNLD
jgi:D-alanyl-D-alanine carboxypeptidase (penicillin-binding protein 5/6)